MFFNFIFKIINENFINAFLKLFILIQFILIFFSQFKFIQIFSLLPDIEIKIEFFDLFTAEIFCFFWILILIFLSSLYSKFFYQTYSYNLQELVKNLFRIILGVLIIMNFMYFRSYYLNLSIWNINSNTSIWINFLHSDLLQIKIFICFLAIFLIKFCIDDVKINNFSNQFSKMQTKYSNGLFEYPLFFLFSFLMCNILLSANHLILVFLSIVGLSLCLYALIAFDKNSYSVEAAAKYFSIGAVASGLMLFGIFSFYYTSQTLFINELSLIWNTANFNENLISINYFFFAGLSSFLFGFFFKLALFPCHMWSPDVYDGTSLLVTALLMTIVKTAIFFI